MSTLQTMTQLKGSIGINAYMRKRVEEERQALDLFDFSIVKSKTNEIDPDFSIIRSKANEIDPDVGIALRISELAILLDGEGRNARFVGAGWGPEGPDFATDDSTKMAIAMVENASARTDIHAIAQVFTMPKSVSLLAAMDRDFRQDLYQIRQLALADPIQYYDENLTIRYRDNTIDAKDNRVREAITGIRGIVHNHSGSAAGDPHMHDHLMFSLTCQGAETGKWGQVDAQQIRNEYARKAQALYDRRVRIEITKLGYKFDISGELVGVDRDLIERASTAHNAVKALQTAVSAATGIEISDEQAWHHWRQIVSGHDDPTIPEELREQILVHGKSTIPAKLREKILGQGNVTIPPELQEIMTRLRADLEGNLSGEDLEHAIDAILADPQTQAGLSAFFAARYGIDEGWVELLQQASREAEEVKSADAMVADIGSLHSPPKLYSAQALAIKHSDFSDKDGQNLLDAVLSDDRVTVAVNQNGRIRHICLVEQDEQEKHVREIANELVAEINGTIHDQLADLTAPITVISGVAGGGKSSALAEIRAAWAGRDVWAVARNSLTASETGRAAGAEGRRTLSATALRGRIGRDRGPARGDVLVVDEFGLLDHRDVMMFLNLAKEGVIVKALGDQHQIQPIDQSASARIVIDVAEQKGAKGLEESKRCAAWIDLHDKMRAITVKAEPTHEEISEVLSMLDVRVVHTAREIAEISETAVQGSEILVKSNRLRSEVAQELLRQDAPSDSRNVVVLTDGGGVWKDCDVVVRQNVWDPQGTMLLAQNGEKGRLTRVAKPKVDILMNDGRSLTLDRTLAKKSLRVGGVYTGDWSQGMTFGGSSVIGITGNETKQWMYSGSTRGMAPPVFVVLVDKDDDPELVTKWALEKVTNVLTNDGIARTVEELKREALLDTSLPRHAGEMVPWLRQYERDLGTLRAGVSDGTISVEKQPAETVEVEVGKASLDAAKIAEADAWLEKIKRGKRKFGPVKPEPEVPIVPDVFVDLTSPIDPRRPGTSPDFGL